MGLIARIVASFDAIKPVSTLTGLDGEFDQLTGAGGLLNGGSSSNRILTKYNHATEPVAEFDQLGAGNILLLKQSGATKLTITNAGLVTPASTSVNTGFNADQVDGIEGANIAKLDTHKTAWSAVWLIDDPSTFTLADDSILPVWLVPEGNIIAVTKIKVVYRGGSHTSGGSVTFAHVRRNAAGAGAASITAISLNNTNNAAVTTYSADFNVSLAAGDQVSLQIASRSGTITERKVSVALIGTQKFTT